MNPNAERALAAVSADVLVTADPFTVGWLTGFAADALWGPSPFAVPARLEAETSANNAPP